jgi:phage-related protein
VPTIGPRCYELRVADIEQRTEWRVVYYVGKEAVAVLDVFAKTTRATRAGVIAGCRRRLAGFRRVAEDER